MKSLLWLAFKFDLDQSERKLSQVNASVRKAWPKGVASRPKFSTYGYLRLRLAGALRSKTSPKSISQSLLFLVSWTCGALHSNDFSSLIQDPCFLLWLPPQGTKAFLTFFLGFVSAAFCLRVDIRAHLQVLGRTVRYVACRLSYIRRVVSFLLENPRGGTAPKPTLLAVASVHAGPGTCSLACLSNKSPGQVPSYELASGWPYISL